MRHRAHRQLRHDSEKPSLAILTLALFLPFLWSEKGDKKELIRQRAQESFKKSYIANSREYS